MGRTIMSTLNDIAKEIGKDCRSEESQTVSTLLNNLLCELERTVRDNESDLLWKYCDCGCPRKRTLRNRASVKVYKLLKAIEVVRD